MWFMHPSNQPLPMVEMTRNIPFTGEHQLSVSSFRAGSDSHAMGSQNRFMNIASTPVNFTPFAVESSRMNTSSHQHTNNTLEDDFTSSPMFQKTMDLVTEDLTDKENYQFQKLVAAITVGNMHSTEEEQEMQKEVEDELFNINNKWKERLFGWMPWGWEDTFKKSTIFTSFSIMIIICLYATGLGSFLILQQRISLCENNFGNLETMSQKDICKGQAENCKMGGDFINFKRYVEYRLAAYFLLSVPFLYMPFMSIMEITHTAKKVWERLGLLQNANANSEEKDSLLKVDASRKDTFDKFSYKKPGFICWASCYTLTHLSATGHEKMLLRLFFFFHVFLGGFSITFDAFLMQMSIPQDSPCDKLQKSLDKISDFFKFTIQQAASYNFAMGIVFFILTLFYIVNQWGNTTHTRMIKKSQQKAKQNKVNKRTRQHRKQLDEVLGEYKKNERVAKEQRDEIEEQRRETQMKENVLAAHQAAKREMQEEIQRTAGMYAGRGFSNIGDDSRLGAGYSNRSFSLNGSA